MSQHNLPKTTDESSDAIANPDTDDIVAGAGAEEINLKQVTMVDEDSPLAQETGSTGPQKRQVDEEWLANFLSDRIYSENSAFIREYLQNAESACIRAAKLLIRNHPDFGEEWLGYDLWVDKESGETVCDYDGTSISEAVEENDGEPVRHVSLPRKLEDIVDAARSIGYDPTIEISLYRDDREIHIEDNGEGMTAHQFDKAFNYTGKSPSKLDSETGGMFGAGALTFGNMTGKEGGMTTISASRRPDEPGRDVRPIKAYTYLGGYNEMPNDDVPEDFRGTRFEVPILPYEEGGPALSDFQDWVEEYADTLRVPVLYREFENGETPVKEEYGGQSIVEKFTDEDGNEPPVVVERPGEFTAVAGPDLKIGRISHRDHRPDTWLVSMPIDRNTSAKVKSFWKVAIQWHNEQGMCISGRHRGMLKEEVEDIADNDVFGPQPTGTRDSLEKDSDNRRAHEFVSEVVGEHELAQVTDIFENMVEADHPADAILENPQDWTMFYRMVDYHGSYRSENKFKNFIDGSDEFPDLHTIGTLEHGPQTREDEAVERIYELFEEVSHAPESVRDSNASKKKKRNTDLLGDILSEVPTENVFMAASTGGNFPDQRRVVKNTFDKWDVVVVSTANSYSKYEEKFGFRYLKHVPVKQDDDHDFDVPQSVHDRHITVDTPNTDTGKAEKLSERKLKIRDNDRNKSIDKRWTIEQVMDHLEDSGSIKGKKLVLFPSGKDNPNISDHYHIQSYAAIASCNQKEFHAIQDEAPDGTVFDYEQFKEWSGSTIIATEKGGRRADDLLRDDEFIVAVNANTKSLKRLLADENETLRDYYKQDVLHQHYSEDDSTKPEPVMAVIPPKTQRRAEFGLNHHINEFAAAKYEALPDDVHRAEYKLRNDHIYGLRFGYDYFTMDCTFNVNKLSGSKWRYEKQANTPNWHDHSEVYDLYRNSDDRFKAILDGLHEAGIDPTVFRADDELEQIREVMATVDASDAMYIGQEDEDAGDADDSDGLGELFG